MRISHTRVVRIYIRVSRIKVKSRSSYNTTLRINIPGLREQSTADTRMIASARQKRDCSRTLVSSRTTKTASYALMFKH